MANERLKLDLIEWIIDLDDLETLNLIKVLKDSTEDRAEVLTEEQISAIERGLKDVGDGNVVSNKSIKRKHGF